MSSKPPTIKVATKIYNNDKPISSISKPKLKVKLAPQKAFLKAGTAVRIFVKYEAQYKYKYSSLFRKPTSGVVNFEIGSWNEFFPKLTQDWKREMAKSIDSTLRTRAEKIISDREDLYGEFNSWDVEVTFLCRFFNIQFRDQIKTVCEKYIQLSPLRLK